MPVMHGEKGLIKPEMEGSQGCTLESRVQMGEVHIFLRDSQVGAGLNTLCGLQNYQPSQAARSRQHRGAQIQGPWSRILSPPVLPCSQQCSVLQAPGLYLL